MKKTIKINSMKNAIYFLILTTFMFSCKGADCICGSYFRMTVSPYDNPVWHPSGQIIGFNHTPIKEIDYYSNNKNGCNCPPYIEGRFDSDSTGFWLINADGSNMHRVLPYMLYSPSWSPDGKQIAFSNDGKLCVMPFDGSKFDTLAIKVLPLQGRGSQPAWSSDGKKIAYTQSISNDSLTLEYGFTILKQIIPKV